MNFYDELKYKAFNSGSRVNFFIALNVIVFLVLSVISIIEYVFTKHTPLSDLLSEQLAVPTYIHTLLKQPWSPFTYMFMHDGFFHILFNMLWLFWIGNILEEFLNGKKVTFVYLMGGLSGAVLYILCYNFLPAFAEQLVYSRAVGASASVMAIVVATATLLPSYTIGLMFLGPVKLKWIALFYVIFDFISISGPNAGGHIAHLGGALFGFFFIKSLKNGNDWCKPFENYLKPKSKLKVVSKNNQHVNYKNHNPNQSEIDAILDKISQAGYENLSQQEKEILFSASSKNEEK
jgi:membrane associated rhomboid family serine protease